MHSTRGYIDPSAAQCYSANSSVQFHQAKCFIDANLHLLKGAIMDVGSGTGEVTAFFAEKMDAVVLGVDISAERVVQANQKYKTDKLQFIVGDAISLSDTPVIAGKKFSTILSFNALHHLPQDKQLTAFYQIKSCLAEDGVALLLVPGRSTAVHDAIREVIKSEKWLSYFADFELASVRTYQTAEYYKTILTTFGFYSYEVTSAVEDGGKALNAVEMKLFLKGWLPHLAHLKLKGAAEELQNELLDDIVTRYFADMQKGPYDAISPKVMQNKIIAYASAVSFFGRKKATLEVPQPSKSLEFQASTFF